MNLVTREVLEARKLAGNWEIETHYYEVSNESNKIYPLFGVQCIEDEQAFLKMFTDTTDEQYKTIAIERLTECKPFGISLIKFRNNKTGEEDWGSFEIFTENCAWKPFRKSKRA